MTTPGVLEFPCIEVTQPIGTFYIGSLDNKIIQKIAWADVRRIEGERREVEIISGLQRQINQARVNKISAYVRTLDATFPTSIILAVKEEDATFNAERNVMSVRDGTDVAKIIDGQHRIRGLQGFLDGTFQLNVAIFVDMDSQDQAIVFSTINLTQTKVSKSLVYDLFELVEARSPQKTCHNIARVAHYSKESPFAGRIKILGRARDKENELLTQAGFVDPLLAFISSNPLQDSDDLKRGRMLKKITTDEAKARRLVFRNLFIMKEDDVIALNILNYFNAVRQRWPDECNNVRPGHILNRTTGYRGFMSVLPFVCIEMGLDREIKRSEFEVALARTTLRNDEFTTEQFPPGTAGERALANRLMNNLGYGTGS